MSADPCVIADRCFLLDKPTEQQRARSVSRQLFSALCDLGFIASDRGSCTIVVGDYVCRVGLQKFVNQPAFRVIFSLEPADGSRDGMLIEHSDR